MSEQLMLYCILCFILGWILCKHIGNGFSVGVTVEGTPCKVKGYWNHKDAGKWPVTEIALTKHILIRY